MLPDSDVTEPLDPGAPRRLAVIDIGSNSLRLVIYEGRTFIPVPFFNEKAICALGKRLGETKRLDPDGVGLAFRALARFVALAEAMEVARLDLLATAAVRDAVDGPDFVAAIESRFGHKVQVLTGDEEARLAAIGVVTGRPDADGLMGDLGGGSLDLVVLDRGRFGDSASLPLGVLRLEEFAGGDVDATREFIDSHLARLPWLKSAQGRTLFPVGGAWRAFARLSMHQDNYPLTVVDNYTLNTRQAEDLARVVARLSRRSLEPVRAISRRRLEHLPMAALLLERLLVRTQPFQVTFSAFGMREGQYFKVQAPHHDGDDPLLNACRAGAQNCLRFGLTGEELRDWTAPIFPDDSTAERRLRYAISLLSDIAWSDHPDYRAEVAERRALRLPYAGLTHGERAAMAVALGTRYKGEPEPMPGLDGNPLISGRELSRARALGLALRLAYTLSGGAGGVLARTRAAIEGGELVLSRPAGDEVFAGEVVERRLAALGKALDVPVRIREV